MGRGRDFPCRDIVPLTLCHDIEIVSRQRVAKAKSNCVAIGHHNKCALGRVIDEFCHDRELSVATDFP